MADFERDDTLPLSGEEMRRLKGRKPAGKPPKGLADIEDKPPPVRKIKFIERAAARKLDAPEMLEGIVPKWVGTSFSPKRIGMPPPPVVTHHQERLEPFVIHQPEDRQMYNDPTYPWICVCRITRADGGVGSGVIVGPRHVLTASHVVQWNTDVAEKVEVHLVGNTARATAFATVAYAYTKITGDPTYSTVDDDYAVLTVDQRLGDRFGFFGAKLYNSSWDGDRVWQTIGYATDVLAFRTNPTFQGGVALDEDEFDLGSGRAIRTTADCMKGQSGSPMFGRWNGDPVAYAVAVVSAGQGNTNWCGGGSDLNRIVRHARTTDP